MTIAVALASRIPSPRYVASGLRAVPLRAPRGEYIRVIH